MAVYPSDQIKCSYVAQTNYKGEIVANPNKLPKYEYTTLDDEPVNID